MKYVKFKNNRFCKIFIFLFILVFGFSVLVFKSDNKVKAGVIIDEIYTPSRNPVQRNINEVLWLGVLSDSSTSNVSLLQLKNSGTNIYYVYANVNVYDGATAGYSRCRIQYTSIGGSPSISNHYMSFKLYEYNNNVYIMFNLSAIANDLETAGYNLENITCTPLSSYGYYMESQNTISSVSNIYDVQHDSVVILYLEDISGLNTTDFATEITIHFGYIDDDDNTTFASYSPTIDIFNDTANNVIKLSLPQNSSGSASTFKEISQNASFSLGDLYDASTTANIYAIYIYLQEDAIYWGYLNFDVPQTPAVPSAQSMQYITGSEQVYAFNYPNTTNMACRLSVSSNVNYITILNQSTFNLGYINPILRQGGFFPAWSLYNWSRGARLGYQAGYDAGEAPFREGNVGYQAIFDAGYRAGQEDSIDTTFLVSLFDSVDAFFSIHLFPLITIGEIIGIPFIISVVWFIIRQLRGGGGSD